MDRLAELRREVARERRAAEWQQRIRSAVPPGRLALLLVPLAIVLPVIVLLRGATFFYLHLHWPTWGAVPAAAGLALGLVTVYAALLSKRLTGKRRVRVVAKWIAAPLVIAYCAHALVFLSRVNAKSDDVRAYYRSLHPTLRLAVSTFVIVDDGLVVTDIERAPSDYPAMGLPVYDSSLHYRQNDGYVHAMDLRTIGRGAVRNRLTEAFFEMLGFRTLRHVGTADHLHVSLPVPR